MYSLAIYIYMFCVNVVAIFNKKARLLMVGHSKTYRILREQIDPQAQYIWFHAASLGEFEQGRPLIERVRRNYPQYRILLTFFSPSGYEVRKNYEGADVVCYLPFDTALNARKFLRLARPCMAFFIKYEFWQNYLSALHRAGIPAFSVSSIFRPNQIFFRSYGQRYARVLECFTHFFVQNETSRRLLESKGLTNVTIVGDTRCDRVLDIRNEAADLPVVEQFVADSSRKVFIVGSSWEPDEDVYLPYFEKTRHKLIIAPHVVSSDRIGKLRQRLSQMGKQVVLYSEMERQTDSEALRKADALLVDCYGKLSSIYRYATVAYVGGGFGVGIHNVPEAAVYGVPVIIGPNNKKFKEAQDLLKVGGCFETDGQEAFNRLMQRFDTEPDFLTRAGEVAGHYIKDNAGAADTIFRKIDFQNIPRYGEHRKRPDFDGMKH